MFFLLIVVTSLSRIFFLKNAPIVSDDSSLINRPNPARAFIQKNPVNEIFFAVLDFSDEMPSPRGYLTYGYVLALEVPLQKRSRVVGGFNLNSGPIPSPARPATVAAVGTLFAPAPVGLGERL